jgi:hypothetical protein
MLRVRRLLTPLCFLTAAIATSASHADDNEAALRAMFEQASRDMDAGAYEKACPALVEVVKLTRGIGSMIKLGKCYEAQGKLASAWASFKEAAEAAHFVQDGREAAANAKAQELFPKLSRLSVTVSAAAAAVPGLTITRDDVDLVKALWNVEMPVDAGKHVVTASAPGKKTWTGSIDVPDAGGRATLEVPSLENEPPSVVTTPLVIPSFPLASPATLSPAPSFPLASPATFSAAPPAGLSNPTDAASVARDRRRTAGLAIGGAGFLAVGVGAATGIVTFVEWGRAKSACGAYPISCVSSGADQSANAYRNTALTTGAVSTVAFIVGGIALATGGFFFFTARGQNSDAQVSLVPMLGPGGNGAEISGVFR